MYTFDDKRSIASHLAIGVAVPYGNSDILPFEKRYFGGGANRVRGWSTRTLGPGTYGTDSTSQEKLSSISVLNIVAKYLN